MPRAGKYRDLVTIQQPTAGSANAYGERVDTWSTLDKVWANWVTLGGSNTGKETLRAKQLQAEATVQVKMRYRSDVTTRMRVVRGTTTVHISAIIPNERQTEMILLCMEEV